MTHTLVCDLESADAVGRIVAAADACGGADILVNNAAIQGPIGPSVDIPVTEFERTMRVDLLLPIALAHAVLPGMIARSAGWIVNLSGGGATGPRPMFSAYGAAKTALVRFGETLAAEVAGTGVRVNSVAPGAFASGMTQAILAGGDRAGAAERSSAERALAANDDANAVKAAKLIVYLVAGAGRDITGKLISAMWDPWSELHLHWEEIRASDVYTLRRIVPADRKLAWGL
jgi:3-oxoacyl-[acyl-carrier protein] reductase